jgi:predicted phage terminase large subunit-like protein
LFKDWVTTNQGLWQNFLNHSNPALANDTQLEFLDAYNDLASTHYGLAPFDEIMSYLPDAMAETSVEIVNSNDEAVNHVKWENNHFWILIGGMKLDRGFTVRGITTTYMPRTMTQNADTLQQRARFFGYHSNYLGLVRVFLGIENASEETLKTYNKLITKNMSDFTLEKLKSRNMNVHIGYIVFEPYFTAYEIFYESCELCQKIEEIWHRRRPDYFLVEKRSSGLSLIPDLRRRGIPVIDWVTDKDKYARMQAASTLVKSGVLWVPMPPERPDICQKTSEWIGEICQFPGGNHDDHADALSQFLLFARDNNLLLAEGYDTSWEESEEEQSNEYQAPSYSNALLR